MFILSFIQRTLSSKRALSILVLALVGVFAGGCGKPYVIIKQATPNPFVGKTQFVVMPVDYTDLHIGDKSEAEYLSGKDDKQQESFAGDKQGVNDKFQESLAAHAADGGIVVDQAKGVVTTFMIKPHVRFIEPGFFTAIVNGASKVEMVVTIADEHGTELDQILVTHGTNSGMFNPSSGQRLRSDGEALGGFVAVYLKDRTAAPGK
jgi:hypothetical protein